MMPSFARCVARDRRGRGAEGGYPTRPHLPAATATLALLLLVVGCGESPASTGEPDADAASAVADDVRDTTTADVHEEDVGESDAETGADAAPDTPPDIEEDPDADATDTLDPDAGDASESDIRDSPDTGLGPGNRGSLVADLTWAASDSAFFSAALDLHFAHPFALGVDLDEDGTREPWFAGLFDWFGFNSNPNWGSLDPAVDDNPARFDDDRWDYEIVTAQTLEDGNR